MTDPIPQPDDHVAGERSRVREVARQASDALRRVGEEYARLADELSRERALRVMREEELRLARAAILNQCGDNLCWTGSPVTRLPPSMGSSLAG